MFKQVLDISLGRKSADKPVASKQARKQENSDLEEFCWQSRQ
jgi:hypothetical protein